MTDRELLELAAKAGGIEYPWSENEFGGGLRIDLGGGFSRYWSPLTDDGDALRLAVKLELNIQHHDEGYLVVWEGRKHGLLEKYGDDPYAATRRAIVRAAAEIGKQLQS